MAQQSKSGTMRVVNCSTWFQVKDELQTFNERPASRNFYERMLLANSFAYRRKTSRNESNIVSTGQLLGKLKTDYSVADSGDSDEDKIQLPEELRSNVLHSSRDNANEEVRIRIRKSEWRRKFTKLTSRTTRASSAKSAASDRNENKSLFTSEHASSCHQLLTARSAMLSARSCASPVSIASSTRSASARQYRPGSVQTQPNVYFEARGRTLGIKQMAPEYLSSSRSVRSSTTKRSATTSGDENFDEELYYLGTAERNSSPVSRPSSVDHSLQLSNQHYGRNASPSSLVQAEGRILSPRVDGEPAGQIITCDTVNSESSAHDCPYCKLQATSASDEAERARNIIQSPVDLMLRYYEEKEKQDNKTSLEQISRHEHCFHGNSLTHNSRMTSPRSRPRSGLAWRKPTITDGNSVSAGVVLSRSRSTVDITRSSKNVSKQPPNFIITSRSLHLKNRYET